MVSVDEHVGDCPLPGFLWKIRKEIEKKREVSHQSTMSSDDSAPEKQ
jgi:hypothetical protein